MAEVNIPAAQPPEVLNTFIQEYDESLLEERACLLMRLGQIEKRLVKRGMIKRLTVPQRGR